MSHLDSVDRAGRLTASVAAAAIGHNPYMSRAKLWRQMTGKEPPFEGNVYTQYGNEHEAEALHALEVEIGEMIDKGRFVPHPDFNWLGASPDGFVGDRIVEVKCAQKIHAFCPQHYKIQMYVQMACCRCDSGLFASWQPDSLMVEDVKFDKLFWEELLFPAMNVFMNYYVKNDISPPRGKFSPEKESHL